MAEETTAIPSVTPTADRPATRRETDSLGSRDVPSDAYWGIHKQYGYGTSR